MTAKTHIPEDNQTHPAWRDWGLLVALCLPLLAILPTLGAGVTEGADTQVHVHRVYAMVRMLETGDLWPRWVSYFHLGTGYPIFNFYAPGSSYLGAIFFLLTGSISAAYTLTNSLAWIIGTTGTYALARRFLPGWPALLAALIWAYAPSRLYEIWFQGSLAQSVAAAFIPWFLLTLVDAIRRPGWRRMPPIALSFAAIALSHTPMMYISALFGGPLVVFMPLWQSGGDWRKALTSWRTAIGGLALAGGLIAIFLLPALLELRYVTISGGIDETVDYLQAQFLPLSEIFAWPHAVDMTDMRLIMPRSFGLGTVLLGLLGVAALVNRRRWGLLLALFAGLGFVLFMTQPISLDLWLTIPGFANLRFPERLLRIGVPLLAIAAGASLLLIPARWRGIGFAAGATLILLQAAPLLRPTDDFIDWPDISARDEIEMEMELHTWGTVSYDEFDPVWGQRVLYTPPEDLERYEREPFHLRPLGRDIAANPEIIQAESLADDTIRITLNEARPVRFQQSYFPGWTATVNGLPAEPYGEEEFGMLTLDLPAGEHTVRLRYTGTPLQAVSTLISISTLTIIITILIMTRPAPVSAQNPGIRRIPALLTGTAFIVLALIGTQIITRTDRFRLASPPNDPAYMAQRVDAPFGDSMLLLGYTLHGDSAAPDQPVQIDLYWRATSQPSVEYQPIVQLVDWRVSEAWAVSQPLLPGGTKTTTYTPDQFISDPHRLAPHSDVPPYPARVMIQLRNLATGEALTLPNGSDRVLLDEPIFMKTDTAQVSEPVAVRLGDAAELRCIGLDRTDEGYSIDLYWRLIGPAAPDLVVLVHGLDAEKALLVQNDRAPFDERYPPQLWREGPLLLDHHSLPATDGLDQIAIGLYERESLQRLPALRNGERLPDDIIRLSLQEQSC